MSRPLLSAAVLVATAALAPFGVAAAGPLDREIVDLAVRPYSVSLAALPLGEGYAAVYDDRLELNALRFAERRNGVWRSSVVASEIDGRRVGREPVLGVSRTGLRVIAFRTDMAMNPASEPNGVLYAARSFPGQEWIVERIDAHGFGSAVAFDPTGRPAVAYLVRTGVGTGAEVRLARLEAGAWHTVTLAATTWLQARNGSNSSRVGVAFDGTGRPWVAYVDPGTRAVRLVTPGAPARRVATAPALAAQAAVAFGAGGVEAVAFAGLSGERVTLTVAYRAGGSRWRYAPLARDGATAPAVVGFTRGRPVVAFRDARGIAVARPAGPTTRAYAQRRVVNGRFATASTYAGALGVARSGTRFGLAFVAPRGLLEFTTERLGA